MINWWKLVKAGLGIVVVFLLVMVVFNWYGDFKKASVVAASSVSTTSTVDPTATASQIVTGTAGTTIGLIKIDGVNFRVKPTSSAKLIRALSKGEKVTVLAKEGQWYKVKDKKNKTGWITASTDYVELQVK